MKQREPILYGIIGLLIGGVIVWLLTSNAVNNNNTGMMQMMGIHQTNSQNTTNMMGNIDRHFIEQMIPHHEDAITMAKLAQTKAKRSEVKQLAENIIDSQGKEISQMTAWYKDWFGEDVPKDTPVMGQHGMTQKGGMHMGMMGDGSDMTKLEQAGDFDKAFVEEMIPHHQMAVMMATMLKNGTRRPEMTKLAEDIISAQNKEIEQMRTWLKEWGN
ncbi:MAG: DUF305 domain-containing protein [bacterium]|nr:DUF305 domain-containing protein [bacterium]